MAVLTNPQLQQLWISNGGNPAAAPMAAAIAEAESSGNSTATNTAGNSAGVDRGIWQINSAYHPEVSNAQAFDPNGNAKAAIRISNNGASWSQWSTFGNGAFRKFLTGAQTAPVGASATLANTPQNRALTSGTASTAGAGGSDLFGSHHSQLLYAAVFVGAVLTAIWLLGTGLNQTTHGAVSRTAKKAATAAATTA